MGNSRKLLFTIFYLNTIIMIINRVINYELKEEENKLEVK